MARKHKGSGPTFSPSAIPVVSPDGVAKFLAAEGITLLIKGYAGVGKTTFALQLLTDLSKGGKGAYISSGVPQNKLLQQYPWMDEISGRTKERSEFIDTRFGTYESLLGELRELTGRKSGDAGVEAIVVDTWDGLAKEAGEKERLKAERTLMALANSSKTRMIFVSEEPGKTTMDYLVDGIIELTRNEEYGRIFREIEIQKLRGTLISQHRYLYTLLEGMFKHFEAYTTPERLKGKLFEPIEDHDDAFSFGSAAMDQAFSGLGKGDTSLFEYAGGVPYSALRLIEVPAIVNALNLGHGAVLVPLPGSGVENLAAVIRSAASEDAVRERLAIMSQGDPGTFKPPFYGLGSMGPDETGQQLAELIKGVRARTKRDGVLVVGSIGSVEGAFASNLNAGLEQISQIISDIQVRSIDTLVLFMPAEAQLRARLIAMSHGHARLFVKDRSVVLLGEKPSTEAMVVEHSRENPILPTLTSIV